MILVMLCWCAALGQTVHDEYFNDGAVPAYQNKTLPQDETKNAFQNLSDSGWNTALGSSSNMSRGKQETAQDSSSNMSHSKQETTLGSSLNMSHSKQNTAQVLPDAKLIFQSEKSQTWEIAEFSDNLTRDSALSYCQTLITSFSDTGQNGDSAASLLSSGASSQYSDFYFYCPFLLERFSLTPYDSSNSNLQIVLTWNQDGSCSHIYLGFPFVEYCF